MGISKVAKMFSSVWYRAFILSIPLLFNNFVYVSASPPEWWIQRGAVNSNPANDYTVANIGQLKHFSTKAANEINANLSIGAGNEINNLLLSWRLPEWAIEPRNDYAALTIGQLKAVGKTYHDRLILAGYPTVYPWTTQTTTDDNDTAVANLGQLKTMFAFDLSADLDSDGFSDWRINQVGLKLWLRAGDLSGPLISNWPNRANLSTSATQAQSNNQPLLVSNVVNGRPAVRFDGNSDFLNLPNVMGGASAGEVLIVLRTDQDNYEGSNGTGGQTHKGLWRYAYAGAFSNGNNYYPDPHGAVTDSFGRANTGSANYVQMGVPPVPLSQFHIYSVTSTSSEWTARFNNVIQFATSSNIVGFRSNPILGLGSSYFPSYFAGEIAEMLVYNRSLSINERSSIFGYLGSKYRIVVFDNVDTDKDGLGDAFELAIGSQLDDPDTNDNGLIDSSEFYAGFDPSSNDVDGDGITNAEEISFGTNPFRGDTDGDGVLDGFDDFPLDTNRSSLSASNPGAPVITLNVPAGVTLFP